MVVYRKEMRGVSMFTFLRKAFSIVLSFIIGFVSYPASYLPCLNDSDFSIETGVFSEEAVTLNGEEETIIPGEGCRLDGESLILNSNSDF